MIIYIGRDQSHAARRLPAQTEFSLRALRYIRENKIKQNKTKQKSVCAGLCTGKKKVKLSLLQLLTLTARAEDRLIKTPSGPPAP